MKFAYLPAKNNEWWEFQPEKMLLLNFNGGGFTVDENSDYWLTAELHDFENWHELYKATGYNPLHEAKITNLSLWIDPNGNIWYADSHGISALSIANVVYGLSYETIDWDEAEDYLISNNWIKVTRGPMWRYYCEKEDIWKMTSATFQTLQEYCDINKIRMPDMNYIKILR